MQPSDETRLPEAQDLGAWRRLILWVRLNRPLAWLVGLMAGLVLFLAWLPPTCGCFSARPAGPAHPGEHDLGL